MTHKSCKLLQRSWADLPRSPPAAADFPKPALPRHRLLLTRSFNTLLDFRAVSFISAGRYTQVSSLSSTWELSSPPADNGNIKMPVWELGAPLVMHINSQILNGGWKRCFLKSSFRNIFKRRLQTRQTGSCEPPSVLAVLDSCINRSLILFKRPPSFHYPPLVCCRCINIEQPPGDEKRGRLQLQIQEFFPR